MKGWLIFHSVCNQIKLFFFLLNSTNWCEPFSISNWLCNGVFSIYIGLNSKNLKRPLWSNEPKPNVYNQKKNLLNRFWWNENIFTSNKIPFSFLFCSFHLFFWRLQKKKSSAFKLLRKPLWIQSFFYWNWIPIQFLTIASSPNRIELNLNFKFPLIFLCKHRSIHLHSMNDVINKTFSMSTFI